MFKILAGKAPIYRSYFQWLWNNVAVEENYNLYSLAM